MAWDFVTFKELNHLYLFKNYHYFGIKNDELQISFYSCNISYIIIFMHLLLKDRDASYVLTYVV
jgi:hypothetical protein